MQKILLFDRNGIESARLKTFSFWNESRIFRLNQKVTGSEAELKIALREKYDILIMISDSDSSRIAEEIEGILLSRPELELIALASDASGETIRSCFLNGASDCLQIPVSEHDLEKSLLRIIRKKSLKNLKGILNQKISQLVNFIVSYKGDEKDRSLLLTKISELAEQIFSQCKNQDSEVHATASASEKCFYESLLKKKPWLEKFIHMEEWQPAAEIPEEFQKALASKWMTDFENIAELILKYRMIDEKLTARISDYVFFHTDRRLSLIDVAEAVNLNASYISHIFKKTTGMNFNDFVGEVKTDRAKVLLKNKNVRIGEVALSLGFANQEYFSRKFKQKTGFTPVDYQKLIFNKKI